MNGRNLICFTLLSYAGSTSMNEDKKICAFSSLLFLCGSLLPRHRASISMVYNVLLGHITHSVGSRCTAVWYPCLSLWPRVALSTIQRSLKPENGEFQIPPCPLLLQQELIVALLSLSSFTEYQLLGCAGMGTGYKGH